MKKPTKRSRARRNLAKMTIEEAIKIVDSSINSLSPEHGAAWEALLLLQGKAGPTGFFVKEAEKRGHKLEPFES